MSEHKTPVSIAAVLIGFVLVGVATRVLAQPVQTEQVGIALTGEVTAVDGGAKTISVRGANGEEGVFEVDEKTTIMSGSEEVDIASLHVGDWISIDADQRGGQKVATYVEVVEDPNPVSAPTPPEATPVGATVVVGHNKLDPALVQIKAGESVTFQNVDAMPGGHTVTAIDGSFSSPGLAKGESWTHSFDVPGVYPIQIKEHPDTKASIVVE
jgi:plastocyanin